MVKAEITSVVNGVKSGRNGDIFVNGVLTEIESISSVRGDLSKAIKIRLSDASSQAKNVIIDLTEQQGATLEEDSVQFLINSEKTNDRSYKIYTNAGEVLKESVRDRSEKPTGQIGRGLVTKSPNRTGTPQKKHPHYFGSSARLILSARSCK